MGGVNLPVSLSPLWYPKLSDLLRCHSLPPSPFSSNHEKGRCEKGRCAGRREGISNHGEGTKICWVVTGRQMKPCLSYLLSTRTGPGSRRAGPMSSRRWWKWRANKQWRKEETEEYFGLGLIESGFMIPDLLQKFSRRESESRVIRWGLESLMTRVISFKMTHIEEKYI